MPLSNPLKNRLLEPELMDDLTLDPKRHSQALRGLERLNLLSRSADILWRPIQTLAQETRRPLKILDIATGAGDVPIGLWRRAKRRGLRIQLEGCDINPTALEYARGRAGRRGADVRFFQLNPLKDPIPAGYDVIICSLFFHHLQANSSVLLLKQMASSAKRMVLVNDLRRHPAGLALALFIPRLICRSPIVRADAPGSVRAAYTTKEISALAKTAGLKQFTVTLQWPWRFLLAWRKTDDPSLTPA